MLVAGFLFAFRAQAQDDGTEVPQLRPLHAVLPPTYWEQHGGLIIVLSGLILLSVGLLIWLALRPQPAVVTPPEILAREALRTLPPGLTEGALLSRVSQILRIYLRQAFALSGGELTTTEFCRSLADHPQVGPKLAGELTEFLRENDRRKFSLEAGGAVPMNAVTAALSLIEKSEARRAGLLAEQTAGAAAPATKPS